MPNNIGKIFMHDRSQAVRLPKEFRLPGKQVRITNTREFARAPGLKVEG
ncbi:MAG: hypothetical protein ABL901_02375 [Hyphomicrobiaceae bacterium]